MPDLQAIASQFDIEGTFLAGAPYGSGHINDTYRVVHRLGTRDVPTILQRINHQIFKNPVALMDNVQRVTTHLRQKLGSDQARRALTLIPTRDGQALHRDAVGHFWRAYVFIEQARTYDAVESTDQAFQAARAFGAFQQMLADLPPPRLHETIPDFHHTPKRFAALEAARQTDPAGRVRDVGPELEFAFQRQSLTGVLLDAGLPERITHNDTKFNNVMLDDATGDGVCVIDLDTVMPGLALYDFGDMVRTTTSPAREDERDLAQVRMQFPMFEALVRGYLSTAGAFLTPAEKALLPVAGQLITFEIGLRFLTDYLNGDTYFKVHREGHNLDRCRSQFRLVASIECQESNMHQLVESLS